MPYVYKNCPIPGGGYVTGFLFSPVEKDVMYIRTDIGGTYKYDFENNQFISLIDHVGMEDLSETFPVAIAINSNNPASLYIACGMDHGEMGQFLVSHDYGKSFEKNILPIPIHGNWNGRGTGARLVVDENDTIFLASPKHGLWVSKDEGKTWTELNVNGEKHCTLVFKKPDSDTLIVGTAGVSTKIDDTHRGHSLYISYDQGLNFEKVSEPDVYDMPKSKMSGFVAHRYAYDGKYFYVTLNHTGEYAYIVEPGYSCDCGQVIGGVLLRYSFDEDGRILGYELISPEKDFLSLQNGYGGIDYSKQTPGLLVLSTITKGDGDVVYRSYDYGDTWEEVLCGLRVGKIEFTTPYMKPCCNGNDSLIHWLSDVKFNPFNENEVWFNSGTGTFGCENFLNDVPLFHDKTTGIEETVHLNLYAPPSGEVKLIDILGDLGGFAFRDLDKPCENSFADTEGNRYITCLNADYSDYDTNVVIVTPRGNWTGKTKGGLIITKDGCRTFERLSMPFGITKEIDSHLHDIENPNVNSGWVALSPDTNNIVWSIADIIDLPMDLVIHSKDGGKTFNKVNIDNPYKDDLCLKVYSDRVNSSLFYGFSDKGNIYVSEDGGASFSPMKLSNDNFLRGVNFGLVDCANKTEIRVESGHEGTMYIAASEFGLSKLVYDTSKKEGNLVRLTEDNVSVFRMGLGILRPDGDYFSEPKAIYVYAKIDGTFGFFRSFDDGRNFERINDDSHMFGEINSVEADKRTFGRFFIASGSRGVIYGEEK